MAKVKAGFLVPRKVILSELRRRQKIHQEQLQLLLSREHKLFMEENSQNVCSFSYNSRLYYLGLQRGIRYQNEWVEWCEEALLAISEYDQS